MLLSWTYNPNSILSSIIFFATFNGIPSKSSTISLIAVSGTRTWTKYYNKDCEIQKFTVNASNQTNISVKIFKMTVKPLNL